MRSLKLRSGVYFCATVGSTAVSLAVLPLATRVIGPSEYGTLALAAAFAALVTTFAQAAQGYVLQEYLPILTGKARSGLLVSALTAVCLAGFVAAIAVLPFAYFSAPWLLQVTGPEQWGIVLCIAATFLGVPWLVCVDMLMLDGRAVPFAIGMVSQSALNGLVTLAFLFVIPRPAIALLLGYCAGQVVLMVVSLVCLRSNFGARVERKWFLEMKRAAFAVSIAGLAESGRTLFERSYLGIWTNSGDLGLLAHAQLYRNAAMSALNSISRATLPINLREARETDLSFRVTYASWSLVQASTTMVCIAFALFGREIIGLLTSGKFVQATPVAMILLAALLLQTSAKREQSLLVARLQGAQLSVAQTVSTAAAVFATLFLVPLLGTVGAAATFFCQTAIQRAIVMWRAHNLARFDLREAWVVGGLLGTGIGFAWNAAFEPDIAARGVAATLVAGIVSVFLWNDLQVLFKRPAAIGFPVIVHAEQPKHKIV